MTDLGEGVSNSVAMLWAGSVKASPRLMPSTPRRAHRVAHGSPSARSTAARLQMGRQHPSYQTGSEAHSVSRRFLGSPPSSTLQNELANELEHHRSRVAQREQVVERVSSADVQQAAPICDKSESRQNTITLGTEPTADQRRAVLTINDALELLANPTTPHPPGLRDYAPRQVRQHLELVESHLQHAAAVAAADSTTGNACQSGRLTTKTAIAHQIGQGTSSNGVERRRRRPRARGRPPK